MRNKITSNIRIAKSNHESQIADKIIEDPKSFYSNAGLHTKSKTKSKIGPLNGENEITVCDNRGMCNIPNNYFSSVFTREDMSNISCALGPTVNYWEMYNKWYRNKWTADK